MARYTASVCRQCRREGMKLFLKGAKCYTKKCPIERRPTPPGQHGVRRRKTSEFGLQLREKQKVRRVYGLLERQFKSYFERAEARPGVTGQNLLQMLETRLDNVVYRMAFATSRGQGPFKLARENISNAQVPDWLSVDAEKLAGTVSDLPRREQMPQELNEQL